MTLKQLSDEYKPVVKVPEACNHHHHHHGLMHFDMDMDMYDSDDEPFYDEEW